jgi:Bifunctional DNA primase/polymerase, N-terminal
MSDLITPTGNLLGWGLMLAKHGGAVFPCGEDKAPATPHGHKDATKDVEKVYDLFERYPGSLIGVATGARSGFDVLDLDLRSGAGAFWEENRDRLQQTRVQKTRSGGYHVFYEHQEGLRNSVSKLAPGCDVRADDGYVIWWHAAGFPIISRSACKMARGIPDGSDSSAKADTAGCSSSMAR